MTYNCNKPEDIYDLIFKQKQYLVKFLRGSRSLWSFNENSDYDYGIIVSDDSEIIDVPGVFDHFKADNRIHPVSMPELKIDLEIVKESDFIDLIKECDPFAIEALVLRPECEKYKDNWVIDPWILRCKFDAVSNNSFAKAKKKMTVEKDLDEYCGVKSLFHSIRLLMFCCFFLKKHITSEERDQVVNLYNDIMLDWKKNHFKWDDFKLKYKPIYNKWHSEVVKACPRPEEFFKNKKQ